MGFYSRSSSYKRRRLATVSTIVVLHQYRIMFVVETRLNSLVGGNGY